MTWHFHSTSLQVAYIIVKGFRISLMKKRSRCFSVLKRGFVIWLLINEIFEYIILQSNVHGLNRTCSFMADSQSYIEFWFNLGWTNAVEHWLNQGYWTFWTHHMETNPTDGSIAYRFVCSNVRYRYQVLLLNILHPPTLLRTLCNPT